MESAVQYAVRGQLSKATTALKSPCQIPRSNEWQTQFAKRSVFLRRQKIFRAIKTVQMLNGSLDLGRDAQQAVGEVCEADLQFAGALAALSSTKNTAGRYQSRSWKSVILKTAPNGRKRSGLHAVLLVATDFNHALSFASAMAKKYTTATATGK